MIQSFNPATEEVLATFSALSQEDIHEKISLAQNCYYSWKKLSVAERKVPMSDWQIS